MTMEIPHYGLKAYAFLFSKYGIKEAFRQSAVAWMVSESMKKKIFSLLVQSGWIKKQSRTTYTCNAPEQAIKGLMEFRVPEIIKKAEKPYTFTKLSAIEIWSDFAYTLRGIEKSPYFIKILKKDLKYWKNLFNKNQIPNYIEKGTNIGEYIIFNPVQHLSFDEKEGFKVDSLKETRKFAKTNEIYSYAEAYIKKKYGECA